MNLSTEKQLMDLQNRLVVAKGEGTGREWGGWGAWGNAFPLLPWEWISNEILLCSAGYNV